MNMKSLQGKKLNQKRLRRILMLNVLEVSRKYQTLVQPSPEQDMPEKTQMETVWTNKSLMELILDAFMVR